MGIKSVAVLCVVLACSAAASRELHSYASVQDDGTLLIKGKRIHLYGVYLPDTGRRCRTNIRPTRCGSRAMLALDFRIQGFVHCYPRTRNADGSLNATCFVDRSRFDEGEDLAAHLLERGLALALPNAPFQYHALERIARHRHRGVWGEFVDGITLP
ncbi:MAG: nuclease-like protein [Gammaproteobacteria bacterium]|nr:nuclease-like protein [Gammaproteobacteria bacterium]